MVTNAKKKKTVFRPYKANCHLTDFHLTSLSQKRLDQNELLNYTSVGVRINNKS